MAQAVKIDFVPFDAYLEGERETAVRHEYVDGQVYAMGGASELHNTVAAELHTAINSHLREECRAFMADMKVKIAHGGKFYAYYPDIMVVCSENPGDPYTRTDPVLILEVLSPSTRRTDLHEKLANYALLPSLLEYGTVSQDTPHVRLHRRRSAWQAEDYFAGDCFTLESVGLELAVEAVYRRVRREVGLDVGSR